MRFGLLTTAIALLLPVITSAQSFGGLGDPNSSFSISVTPSYPAPYSKVVLSFLSSSLDLTNATLSVSAGGKNIYKGTVQPVSVTLGRSGSMVNITATISSGGTNYDQTLNLQPEDVALIAEPISSAPVLYPGKPLVPLEGSVRVVAIASLKNAKGSTFDPATLSYAWTVDDTQIANSSGIGKEAIMVASPLQYRSRDVSVVVTNADGSLVGGASLSLLPMAPSVRIYENDPLLGIRFDHALSGGYAIGSSEATLYAAPFSLPTTTGSPLLKWFLNGTAAQTGSSITLRPSGSGQGSAALSLVASAGESTTATANLSLSFGAKTSINFFGL
jgi:hypothetical protein